MIGMFELGERVDIPYRVVINEAVDLCKRFGATDAHKYVNAVLDRAARELRAARARKRTATMNRMVRPGDRSRKAVSCVSHPVHPVHPVKNISSEFREFAPVR